jgi:hypothetical protein
LWNPTSREKRARCPDFLYAASYSVAYAAFIKESRMKFIKATRLYRKSGGVGHPGFVAPIKILRLVFVSFPADG